MAVRTYAVPPSAARLTGSLRDIGYDFVTAAADLVDNSVSAGAGHVQVIVELDEAGPFVLIADDGDGMSANRATEALRFGSRRQYGTNDLGRYGLGLKTASLSQCRCVTVISRRPGRTSTTIRQLNLDLVERFDEWLIVCPRRDSVLDRARLLLDEQMSTVIVWQNLDRTFPGREAGGGWARRRVGSLTARAAEHLAMVFHRYLDGSAGRKIVISVNGEKLQAWDPYASNEPGSTELPRQSFELSAGGGRGTVTLRRWVLPHRRDFTSPAEFERLAGPLKWNRQQGLYIYRASRLVQWGGWAALRAIDEHTKLARCSLDFNTDLDPAFNINVAKMKVSLPGGLRQMIERPILEVCQSAEDRYRRADASDRPRSRGEAVAVPRDAAASTLGIALVSAAVRTGHYDALKVIAAVLCQEQPDAAAQLGLDRL